MGQTNVTTFTDKYGQERVIYRSRPSYGMRLRRARTTPVMAITSALSHMVGAKVKAARLRKGLTLEQLCVRAGLIASNPKQRMYEIEKSTRKEGVSLGTIYALAFALDVPVCELLPAVEDFRPMLKMETIETIKVEEQGGNKR